MPGPANPKLKNTIPTLRRERQTSTQELQSSVTPAIVEIQPRYHSSLRKGVITEVDHKKRAFQRWKWLESSIFRVFKFFLVMKPIFQLGVDYTYNLIVGCNEAEHLRSGIQDHPRPEHSSSCL
jgi:hypothetical protein